MDSFNFQDIALFNKLKFIDKYQSFDNESTKLQD